MHEKHWAQATAPTERDRASFLKRDFEIIEAEGNLTKVEGDDPAPPMEGVQWVISNGHTPYLLLPLFENTLLFTGDMIPTSSHLSPAWVMAYDLFPLTTLEEKKRVLKRCREEGLLLAFPHDHRMGGCEVSVSDKKVEVKRPLIFERDQRTTPDSTRSRRCGGSGVRCLRRDA